LRFQLWAGGRASGRGGRPDSPPAALHCTPHPPFSLAQTAPNVSHCPRPARPGPNHEPGPFRTRAAGPGPMREASESRWSKSRSPGCGPPRPAPGPHPPRGMGRDVLARDGSNLLSVAVANLLSVAVAIGRLPTAGTRSRPRSQPGRRGRRGRLGSRVAVLGRLSGCIAGTAPLRPSQPASRVRVSRWSRTRLPARPPRLRVPVLGPPSGRIAGTAGPCNDTCSGHGLGGSPRSESRTGRGT
jgi:hypothetical protein